MVAGEDVGAAHPELADFAGGENAPCVWVDVFGGLVREELAHGADGALPVGEFLLWFCW